MTPAISALDHAIILPVLLPALTAAFLVLALRHHLRRERIVSLAATGLLLALAIITCATLLLLCPGSQ